MKDKPIGIMILVLIICSLFIPLSINGNAFNNISETKRLDRYVYFTNLECLPIEKIPLLDKSNIGFELDYNLGISDGIKNGLVIFGNCARNIASGAVYNYIDGFNYKTTKIKMVWLFFGFFWELLRNTLISLLDFVMMFFILLFQSTEAYLYILSYVLTVLLVIGIAKSLK